MLKLKILPVTKIVTITHVRQALACLILKYRMPLFSVQILLWFMILSLTSWSLLLLIGIRDHLVFRCRTSFSLSNSKICNSLISVQIPLKLMILSSTSWSLLLRLSIRDNWYIEVGQALACLILKNINPLCRNKYY